MIKQLKKAAEFLGYTVSCGSLWEDGYRQMELDCFNPHLPEGRHWLVEMEKDLIHSQWNKYKKLMRDIYDEDFTDSSKGLIFDRWFKTAPSEISFKCIMEVIEE